MNWYLEVLRNYVNFSGRARRREYWFFVLINAVIIFVLELLSKTMFGTRSSALTTLYALAVLLPSLAVGVRRLHDTGRTGWWLLISMIPVVGAIVLLVFSVQDSQPGGNAYGPSPKLEPLP